MKILYINSLYAPYIKGGAEISLKILVEGMQQRGLEVVVLSLVPDGALEMDYVDGVKVYRAGLENLYWPYSNVQHAAPQRLLWHIKDRENIAMKAHVREVLLKEKPDIVSCHNLAGWSVAAWDEIHQQGIPIIQVLHDMYLLCPNSNMYKGDTPCEKQCVQCSLLRLNHRKKSSQVDAVVGISHSILNRFLAAGYFPKASTHVIHNTRSIASPGPVRSRKPGAPLRVGYLGTLSKIKGVEWLIEAFKELEIPATLAIAGKGKEEYEQHLKAKAEGAAIKFLGYCAPAALFEQIDVLVVPSLWQEPLGMVAIEALAHHIPVIAHRAGGLMETVQDGVNGLFCDAENPSSLTRSLEKLFEDTELYQRLSAAARPSMKEILNQDRMVNAYYSVIKEISGHHSLAIK